MKKYTCSGECGRRQCVRPPWCVRESCSPAPAPRRAAAHTREAQKLLLSLTFIQPFRRHIARAARPPSAPAAIQHNTVLCCAHRAYRSYIHFTSLSRARCPAPAPARGSSLLRGRVYNSGQRTPTPAEAHSQRVWSLAPAWSAGRRAYRRKRARERHICV